MRHHEWKGSSLSQRVDDALPLPRKRIASNDEQYAKALPSIPLTLSGTTSDSSEEHPSNALSLIYLSPSVRVRDRNCRTALKSALLYLFNTFGDDHRFESLTSLKRFAANGDNTAGNPYRSKVDAPLERKPGYFFTPSGITTDLREQHSSNAQSPISFTLFGISTD